MRMGVSPTSQIQRLRDQALFLCSEEVVAWQMRASRCLLMVIPMPSLTTACCTTAGSFAGNSISRQPPVETDSYIAVQLLKQGQQLDGEVSDNRQPTAVSADDRRQRQRTV